MYAVLSPFQGDWLIHGRWETFRGALFAAHMLLGEGVPRVDVCKSEMRKGERWWVPVRNLVYPCPEDVVL